MGEELIRLRVIEHAIRSGNGRGINQTARCRTYRKVYRFRGYLLRDGYQSGCRAGTQY